MNAKNTSKTAGFLGAGPLVVWIIGLIWPDLEIPAEVIAIISSVVGGIVGYLVAWLPSPPAKTLTSIALAIVLVGGMSACSGVEIGDGKIGTVPIEEYYSKDKTFTENVVTASATLEKHFSAAEALATGSDPARPLDLSGQLCYGAVADLAGQINKMVSSIPEDVVNAPVVQFELARLARMRIQDDNDGIDVKCARFKAEYRAAIGRLLLRIARLGAP